MGFPDDNMHKNQESLIKWSVCIMVLQCLAAEQYRERIYLKLGRKIIRNNNFFLRCEKRFSRACLTLKYRLWFKERVAFYFELLFSD